MIVAAVDLARPLLARRHRDRQLDARISREQLARQRGLAGARRRRQHQHQPAAGDCIGLLVTAPAVVMGSFQVLHLLAELLDHALELQADIGELHIVRLGAQRVGFAIELLSQEIEPAADRAAVGDQPLACATCERKPIKLLADVGLAGDQDRLLMQAVGIEAVGGSSSAATCSAMRALIASGRAARRRVGAGGQRGDLAERAASGLRPAPRLRAGASRQAQPPSHGSPR